MLHRTLNRGDVGIRRATFLMADILESWCLAVWNPLRKLNFILSSELDYYSPFFCSVLSTGVFAIKIYHICLSKSYVLRGIWLVVWDIILIVPAKKRFSILLSVLSLFERVFNAVHNTDCVSKFGYNTHTSLALILLIMVVCAMESIHLKQADQHIHCISCELCILCVCVQFFRSFYTLTLCIII